MNANTQQLHALGQSLWIDHITRQILDDRTLERYIAELAREGRSGYIEALADRLQREGADAFAESRKCLLVGIADKTSQLNGAPTR